MHSANSTVITFKNHKDGNGTQNNNTSSTFTASETVTGVILEQPQLVSSVTFGDIDNHYIPLDDRIIGIVNIFDINSTTGSQTTASMFNFRYQFHLNEMPYLASEFISKLSNDSRKFTIVKRYIC